MRRILEGHFQRFFFFLNFCPSVRRWSGMPPRLSFGTKRERETDEQTMNGVVITQTENDNIRMSHHLSNNVRSD